MSSRLRQAYAEFLRRYPWDLFVTVTFDPNLRSLAHHRNPERSDKDFRGLICFTNERLYGKRWLRRTKHKGVIWARVQEPHVTGSLHFHALVHSPSAPITLPIARAVETWWERRYGMARVEVPRSQADVAKYLVKYVGEVDQAELDFSVNF